jgi:hypothetical protein
VNESWGDGIFSQILNREPTAAQKQAREQKLDAAIEEARKTSGVSLFTRMKIVGRTFTERLVRNTAFFPCVFVIFFSVLVETGEG